MPQSVLSRLSALVFFDSPPLMDRELQAWLLLESSMTQRLARYCQRISITVVRQGFTDDLPDAIGHQWLPDARRYWRREIILSGDGVPWLAARTLLPESTLCGREKNLPELGDRPLGDYLFSHPQLTRDFIHIGRCAELWGRRSGLYLSGKPLLLTELFLAASPLYTLNHRPDSNAPDTKTPGAFLNSTSGAGSAGASRMDETSNLKDDEYNKELTCNV